MTMTMQDLIDLIPDVNPFTRADLVTLAKQIRWYDKYDLNSHRLNEEITRTLTKMAREGFLEFVQVAMPGKPNIYRRTERLK